MLSDEAEARLQAAIAADPDNPELTADELAALRPAGAALPAKLLAALKRGRGRPKAQVTKVPVKLRLDPEAVRAFKSSGPGWQTRINALVVAAAKELGQAPAEATPPADVALEGAGSTRRKGPPQGKRRA